ncbi:cold shock domain-containing protein [Streptomyces boncukensis]|uniref:Cold shock domain-containing protein n=1 Tax=Streptomyces boncukensis TaxID=2711219 RepID=A0A6G4WTU3_9ACTN|nr:cold shock domain-containing protein [Streptomyces boncukensis]
MAVGRLLRFDEARGYGFIRPQGGGVDVFMHANDFEGPREALVPGTMVEFEFEEGDRGLRAVAAHAVAEPPAGADEAPQPLRTETKPQASQVVQSQPQSQPRVHGSEPLSLSEFMREVTDKLIVGAPTATGMQIAQIRKCFGDVARSHGWVLD